jgi:hypothetical protein
LEIRRPDLEHDPEKWEPVFGKDHAPNKELDQDDDSTNRHPDLGSDFKMRVQTHRCVPNG